MFEKRLPLGLAFIFVAALLLRVVWVFWVADVVFFDKANTFSAGDTGFYLGIAHSILSTGAFANNGTATAFVTPLYPLFLALIFKVFGEHIVAVQLIQIVLSALTLLLIYGMAQRLFSERAALTAAALGAVHIYLIHWNGFILTDSLFVFLLTGGVYCFICFYETPSYGWATTTGAVAGVAALNRSVAIGVFALLGVVWLIRYFRNRRIWPKIAVLGVVAALMILPWTLRNYLEFHAFIPVTTQFGEVVFRGNNPNSRWLYGEPEPGNIPKLDFRGMTPQQMDVHLRDVAFQFIANHPKQFLSLVLRRLYLYWSPDFPTYSWKHNLFNVVLYLPLYSVMVLGLVGLWRNKAGYAWIFLIIFLFFTILHALTIVDWDQRYRLPLQPFILILAGEGLLRFFCWASKLKTQQFGSVSSVCLGERKF